MSDEINQTNVEEETRDAFVIASMVNNLKFSGFTVLSLINGHSKRQTSNYPTILFSPAIFWSNSHKKVS